MSKTEIVFTIGSLFFLSHRLLLRPPPLPHSETVNMSFFSGNRRYKKGSFYITSKLFSDFVKRTSFFGTAAMKKMVGNLIIGLELFFSVII